MGWNDRLPDNPYEPYADRQSYEDWQEYNRYLDELERILDESVGPPIYVGLTSVTVDPTCYETDAIDIFGQRICNTPTAKEQHDGQDQEETSQQGQERRQPNHQD